MEKQTKEYKVDRVELDKLVLHSMEEHGLSYDNRNRWSDNERARYKNIRSMHYNQLRKEAKEKKANFWIDQVSAGNVRAILEKYGFVVWGEGKVCCKNNGEDLIKVVLKTIILPYFRDTLGIDGVTLSKTIGPQAYDLLNWDNAKVREDLL